MCWGKPRRWDDSEDSAIDHGFHSPPAVPKGSAYPAGAGTIGPRCPRSSSTRFPFSALTARALPPLDATQKREKGGVRRFCRLRWDTLLGMCGRYRLTSTERFLDRFEVENEIELVPRFNIAPSQQVAVVRQDRERPVRKASYMRWGLVPYWSKDDKSGFKMINARAESAADRPAFREPLQRRRCLIPADGFFEWQRRGSSKQPFHFGMADESLFAFAGIWDRWKPPGGDVLETCSILTTTPNSLLADVHDRMPVILAESDYDLWLDPGYQKCDGVLEMLRPFDAAAMKRYPVSTRVNSVANDDAECVAEVSLESTSTEESTDTLFPM